MNFEDHKNYNCEFVDQSGNSVKVFSNWFHNQKLDHWLGWECHAGSTRLYIDKDLEIWSGECKNDYLGHALKGFEILEKTVCKQNQCSGCTDDLSVRKRKIL